MNTNKYANELKKANGLEIALRIAYNSMKNTDPSSWPGLPHSQVFYAESRQKEKNINTKYLTNLNGFWTNVYHILKKMEVSRHVK